MTAMPSKAEIGGIKNMRNDILGTTALSDLLRKGDYVPEIFFIG